MDNSGIEIFPSWVFTKIDFLVFWERPLASDSLPLLMATTIWTCLLLPKQNSYSPAFLRWLSYIPLCEFWGTKIQS
jgi:hypothetical protein